MIILAVFAVVGFFGGITMILCSVVGLIVKGDNNKKKKEMLQIHNAMEFRLASYESKLEGEKKINELLENIEGRVTLPPEKTPARIEFVGKDSLEFYNVGGKEVIRAIDDEGKDLGKEFDTTAGAVVALLLLHNQCS